MDRPSPDPLRETLRYWELRRIAYNLVLTAAAIAWVVLTWPHFRPAFTPESIAPLLFLAIMANVCYCAVYVAEALVHDSAVSETWRRRRWILLLAGTLLALLIENYWIADEIYPYVPFVR